MVPETTKVKEPEIFLIQSIGKESRMVFDMVLSAAESIGAIALRDNSMRGEISDYIDDMIKQADLIVADVTDANPNVMYEIGFAKAQKKPIVLIAEGSRSIPLDLASFFVLIFGVDSSYDFILRLSATISKALKEPKAFFLSESATEKRKNRSVFISYSHNDRIYMDRLLVHLKPLEKEGLIDLWVDTRLKAGDRWKKEITKALNEANVAILLVSADFLASDFIIDNELPPLLRNAEEQGTRIIPLIVKPCRFTRDQSLRHFQAINNPSDALIGLTEAEQESYYDSVAAEVEKTLRIN